MSRIRCTPGSTVSPTQTTKPWEDSSARRRASSSAPRTEESTKVAAVRSTTMPPPRLERLVEALAQRRRGVDVVLALDDDDDDVAGGVVEHDRVGFHRAGTLPNRAALGTVWNRWATGWGPTGPSATSTRRRSRPPPRRPAADARALRRAGASRPRDALGPAARARGHARLLGGPEGHPARSRAQPPRRAHGGPPARVPRVPRRHPRGLLRRRIDADLGPRHLRAAQVARGRGDGHLPRRAPGGPLRPVPHGRQELDDPPDGSAAGRGPRADAERGSSRCSRARGRSRPRTAAGPTRSSGTACARSATRRAAGCGSVSRNGNDITPRYPELRELGRALGSREAVLDGEVVAFGPDGKPSFQAPAEPHARRLRERAAAARGLAAGRLRDLRPAVPRRPLADGRCPTTSGASGCSRSGSTASNWQTPAHRTGDGAALLEATRAQGLEGIIAKRLDCPYVPGRRSQGWVKVKNIRRTEAVIGGWLGGEGGRAGRLGALVVGYHDESGALRYAGRVGTGFDDRELDRLGRLLAERARDDSPFEGRQPPEADALRRARPRGLRRLLAVDEREHAAPALLQGPARRHRARRRARPRRRLVTLPSTRGVDPSQPAAPRSTHGESSGRIVQR